MTDWQKKYNKCWPGVLSEEAIARIEKAIFLPSGDPADPIIDGIVLTIMKQNPYCGCQLYF